MAHFEYIVYYSLCLFRTYIYVMYFVYVCGYFDNLLHATMKEMSRVPRARNPYDPYDCKKCARIIRIRKAYTISFLHIFFSFFCTSSFCWRNTYRLGLHDENLFCSCVASVSYIACMYAPFRFRVKILVT